MDQDRVTAYPPQEMTLDELRPLLARALPNHAGFDGWTPAALAMAAKEVGVPAERAALVFPNGAAEMIEAWLAAIDADMAAALAAAGIETMKVRERIRLAVWTRLRLSQGHREAVRRALNVLARPQNAVRAARLAWSSADAMWRAASDASVDFSYYSKRMTLAALYSSVLLVWLNDDSEGEAETAAFLDRRIDDVMRIEKAKARWRGQGERAPSIARFLGRLRYPAI